MPQERYNTLWVRENNAGLVLRSYRNLRAAVNEMTERLAEFRLSLEQHQNRAVFEIPPILEAIMDSPRAARRPALQARPTGASLH